jgi:hypothetical protein
MKIRKEERKRDLGDANVIIRWWKIASNYENTEGREKERPRRC